MKTFEDFLQDKFMDLREIGGMPIMKDNAEDMFDNWLSNLDGQEYMDFAEEWGEKRFLDGKELVLKTFEPNIEKLKQMLMKYTDPKPQYDGMTAGSLSKLFIDDTK